MERYAINDEKLDFLSGKAFYALLESSSLILCHLKSSIINSSHRGKDQLAQESLKNSVKPVG